MNKNIKKKQKLIIFWSICLLFYTRGVYANNDPEQVKYEKSVSIAVKLLKQIYEPNEPVTLIIAIANHSSEPIYLFQSEKDFFEGFCSLSDVNELPIMGDSISTPSIPTSDHYMEINGKMTYVDPVYKIDGKGIMIVFMKDALKIYHKHINEGIFQIEKDLITVIHQANLIIREDTPHRFWIDPISKIVKVRHKVKPETIQIEIRKNKTNKAE